MAGVRQRVGSIPGALMLGVGAIVQPKARADDHWSVTPKVVLADEAPSSESGDPPA